MHNYEDNNTTPLLMLRDTIIFPFLKIPLFIGREQSVAAVKAAWNSGSKLIMLVAQMDQKIENPSEGDVYNVGTLSSIDQLLELSDGTVKIIVCGKNRAKINKFNKDENYLSVETEVMHEVFENEDEARVLQKTTIKELQNYAKFNHKIPFDLVTEACSIEFPNVFSDTIISFFPLSIEAKQKFLEDVDINKRLEGILSLLQAENNAYFIEKKIRGRVKKQIEKTQREYYLNEQLRAIHKELGNTEEGEDELLVLEEKIKKTDFTLEAKERAFSRLKKLRNMNSMSAEAGVVRSYLEWLLDIPWGKNKKKKINLKTAEGILERDHYGLKSVKDRILEHLAVQLRVKKIPGQILCLVGPPGVGKTSLGKSIAEATGRAFVRMSLGGVSDEAEIRGHRSTYIGAMPGKIIQGMKKAKTSDPLFLLDEVDKLGHDWRGDPTSALLEVLDTEQNSAFNDHYVEVDYDLSNVMFIATANTLDMSRPLLDRMEIIRLSGYTEDEKVQIALHHLIPKQMKCHGLSESEFFIEENIIKELIQKYTREAGVRELERKIATIARKAVRELMTSGSSEIRINQELLTKYCGPAKYTFGKSELFTSPGISTGLAWTEAGGDILFIEVLILSGKGNVIQTGKLGDVMKESIQASLSYVKSKSDLWNLGPDFFEKHDVHVHVPEGATPKDGPSAGVAICTAITSALTKVMVRYDVAMTGEINLRGQVLEIGGIKEKLLAAHRAGIKKVILPKENEKDLEDLDCKIKDSMDLVFVKTLDEVLHHSLTEPSRIGF